MPPRAALPRRLIAGAGALLIAATSLSTSADDEIFGWVEMATVEPWGTTIKAKLDSGALTSSLDARDIERFEKDGEEWVRFRLELEDERSDAVLTEELEKPIYRSIKVRGAGGSARRAVVLMEFCLGNTRYEEQVGLRDRSEMFYPLLLGRRTIEHLGLLDVRKTFINGADCDEDAEFVANDPDDD
ncbi:Uncharacterized conserved protein [Franzmannia pantelleriensis]|uniref:Uncharacterized conserved protein n=1 Tax=Franzmannia pantelleriensis TaxID=48727 RepID=A0A1G9TBH4_9GAMM|nr:ATP-dependent zinc protease [Halomonas pantelleriensis]SDM45051.1 Uncharacterized conserved protein [Halomonas pantelleriensis]